MIKKKIIPLVLAATLSLSVGLIGCGNSNDGTTTGNNKNNNGAVTQDLKDAAIDTKDNVVGLWDKVTDNSMDYTADKVKQDLTGKGYKLTEVSDTKINDKYHFFKERGKTYDINGEYLTIYEYKEDSLDTMKEDINAITDEGKKISNKEVSWAATPHVYKKGRVVAIYDGKSSDVLTALKDVLGNPILG